ncbi:MAG TPA: hypothetical protein VIO94_04015, partial [Phenylobacterium sp.]
MPGRDDFGRNSEYEDHQRRRRELERDPRSQRGDEPRAFGRGGQEERYGSQARHGGHDQGGERWRQGGEAARFDQDRVGYGQRRSEPQRYGYGGQEYGMEAQGGYGGGGFAQASPQVQRATDGETGREQAMRGFVGQDREHRHFGGDNR